MPRSEQKLIKKIKNEKILANDAIKLHQVLSGGDIVESERVINDLVAQGEVMNFTPEQLQTINKVKRILNTLDANSSTTIQTQINDLDKGYTSEVKEEIKTLITNQINTIKADSDENRLKYLNDIANLSEIGLNGKVYQKVKTDGLAVINNLTNNSADDALKYSNLADKVGKKSDFDGKIKTSITQQINSINKDTSVNTVKYLKNFEGKFSIIVKSSDIIKTLFDTALNGFNFDDVNKLNELLKAAGNVSGDAKIKTKIDTEINNIKHDTNPATVDKLKKFQGNFGINSDAVSSIVKQQILYAIINTLTADSADHITKLLVFVPTLKNNVDITNKLNDKKSATLSSSTNELSWLDDIENVITGSTVKCNTYTIEKLCDFVKNDKHVEMSKFTKSCPYANIINEKECATPTIPGNIPSLPEAVFGAKVSPLFAASIKGLIDMIKAILFSNVVDKNSQGTHQDTPLIAASLLGHKDAVKELIDKGADVTKKDEDDFTALHKVAQALHVAAITGVTANINQYKEIAEMLLIKDHNILNAVADTSASQADGTPLHMALHYKFYELALYLIQKGANSQIINSFTSKPAYCEISTGTKLGGATTETMFEASEQDNLKGEIKQTVINIDNLINNC